MVNELKHYWKLEDGTFTISIDHCEHNSVGKSVFWLILKIMRLFFNTLTTDQKYFLLKREKLTQPVQILLSEKRKTFS